MPRRYLKSPRSHCPHQPFALSSAGDPFTLPKKRPSDAEETEGQGGAEHGGRGAEQKDDVLQKQRSRAREESRPRGFAEARGLAGDPGVWRGCAMARKENIGWGGKGGIAGTWEMGLIGGRSRRFLQGRQRRDEKLGDGAWSASEKKREGKTDAREMWQSAKARGVNERKAK